MGDERVRYWRYKLRSCYERFSEDLDIIHILPFLQSSHQFGDDLVSLSDKEISRVSKVIKLLEVVEDRGYNAFIAFKNSLQEPYPWLVNTLDKISLSPDDAKCHSEACLQECGVPSLPCFYVERKEMEDEVARHLQQLGPGGILVLDGMTGSGKSCLAISVLRKNPEMVLDLFNKKVFWISAGDFITGDQVSIFKSWICRKVCSLNNSNESELELGKPSCRPGLKEALIVIDDLRSEWALTPFVLGCKVLITTNSRELMDRHYKDNYKCLTVDPKLTMEESMELFRLSIGSPTAALPGAAVKIYKHYRGHPLLMALMGSIFAKEKRTLIRDSNAWAKYFPSRFTLSNMISSKQDKINRPIELCIKSLSPELCETYMKLAVLPQDAKVTEAALRFILDLTANDVKSATKKFIDNNLLIAYFNIGLETWEYEVHDLIMQYLQSCCKNGKMAQLHADVVKRYRMKSYECDLKHLIDDNYICYYIAYHIKGAGNLIRESNILNTLFADLTFIGNKVRLAGPSDLFNDLGMYKNEIGIGPDSKVFFDDLERFLKYSAHDLYYYRNTDIVQHILQHQSFDSLYEKALQFTKLDNNRTNLYLDFPHDHNDCQYQTTPITNQTTEEVSIVCFSQSKNVLIGMMNGNIMLFSMDIDSKKSKKIFQPEQLNNSKKAVSVIALNKIQPYKMATCSVDSLHLTIWTIGDNELDDDCNAPNLQSNRITEKLTSKSGPFIGGVWAHKSDTLYAYTRSKSKSSGCVIAYYMDGNKDEFSTDLILDVAISHDDKLLFVGTSANNVPALNIYNTELWQLTTTIAQELPTIALFPIPNNPEGVLVLTEKSLVQHSSLDMNLPISHLLAPPKGSITEYSFRRACVAADHSVMFISTTDNRILVYNLKIREIIKELNNQRGIVRSMDTILCPDYRNFHILISECPNDPKSIKLWYIENSHNPDVQDTTSEPKLSMKFDCKFHKKFNDSKSVQRSKTSGLPSNASTLSRVSNSHTSLQLKNFTGLSDVKRQHHVLTAVVDYSNKIQVFQEKRRLAESPIEEHEITVIALSRCGRYVIYGLKNGDVKSYHWENDTDRQTERRTPQRLMSLNEPVNYLEIFNNTTIVAAGNSILKTCEACTSNAGSSVISPLHGSGAFSSQEYLDEIHSPHALIQSRNSSPVNEPMDTAEIKPETASKEYVLTSPIIKCFHLGDKKMVSVSRDGSVKLWNLPLSSPEFLLCERNFEITCVCLQNLRIMVLCDSSGEFQVYNIFINKGSPITLELHYEGARSVPESPKRITSCCISADCKILALGMESGDIVLWDISKKIEIYSMSLDKYPVLKVMFSPVSVNLRESVKLDNNMNGHNGANGDEPSSTPLVLLSLSTQIAWWDVSSILKNAAIIQEKRKSNNLSMMQSHSNYSLTNEVPDVAMMSPRINFSSKECQRIWKNKSQRRPVVTEHLMACIKLVGDTANTTLVDDYFANFVTIDSNGTFYVMNVLDNDSSS